MARAITTGGWTILLLSTLCGSTMYPQRSRVRSAEAPPASVPTAATQPPASAAQPAAAAQGPVAPPAAQVPARPQPAVPESTQVAPSMLQEPAKEAQIVFADDSLSIRADNSSLAAILRQVASRSGMKVEGLGGDERVFGNFGPGAPRDVLANLLDGTAYNLVLLGDLNNGAPRELILTPATRAGSTAPSPAPQANADEANNEQESVEVPPPPPHVPPPPPGTSPQTPPGVRTPQQLFEQLQRMRAGQQQGQQQQQPPVQQDSPQQ
jgi:hypothetical protein